MEDETGAVYMRLCRNMIVLDDDESMCCKAGIEAF